MAGDGGPSREARVLFSTSVTAAVLAVVPLVLTIVAAFLPRRASGGFLVSPAILAGLLSPAVGYHLYHALRRKVAPEAGMEERCASFRRANWVALGTTEVIAVFGAVTYIFSDQWPALAGVATHVIVTGAIWPTRERLDHFLQVETDRRKQG